VFKSEADMVVFGFACKHKIILFSSIDGAAGKKIKFQEMMMMIMDIIIIIIIIITIVKIIIRIMIIIIIIRIIIIIISDKT